MHATENDSISAYGPARSTIQEKPLTARSTAQDPRLLASLQLPGLGMIYLQDNPLLREPLKPEHIKNRLLGHWGSEPRTGILLHPSEPADQEVRPEHDLHGRTRAWRARRARPRLSGRHLLEIYPDKSEDDGRAARVLQAVLVSRRHRQPLHPETPGSIHEGGELGYVLSHACGAAFDNPDLIVAAVVGDGEAETGPLATSWHINKFLNPIRDGAVLPILHLNGYKINNPTLLARISHEEVGGSFPRLRLDALFRRGLRPREHASGDGGHAWSIALRDQEPSAGSARTGESPTVRAGR